MEFKVCEVQVPEKITFNYEELKAGLLEKASLYEAMVYGDDEIKKAKADRSSLNKLKKALNDERIRQEKEYMKPFNEFKSQVNEIISIIDKPINAIDSQVKAYEESLREEKLEAIKEYWESTEHPEWLQCNMIFNQKWLNASSSMKKIKEEIDSRIEEVVSNLKTLESLPEFSFEALEEYKRSLDINRAIAEGQRLADIQKRKAEAEAEAARLKAEAEAAQKEQISDLSEEKEAGDKLYHKEEKVPEIEPQAERKWISFAANMTVDDAMALKEFFTRRHIEFKAI